MKTLIRFVLIIPLALIETSVNAAGVEFLAFDPQALPAGIQTQGKIVAGARWRDRLGENLLVATQTGARPSRSAGCGADDEPCFDAEVHADHYLGDFRKRISPAEVECTIHLTERARTCHRPPSSP